MTNRPSISTDDDDKFRYHRVMEAFESAAEPAFEHPDQQRKVWGDVWGCNSEVGQLRKILVHRPGEEIKRVTEDWYDEEIGSYCNREEGIWWRGRDLPDLEQMQATHDRLTDTLRAEGVEVIYIHDKPGNRPVPLKQMSPRDIVIAIPGGAVICRPNAMGRREEMCWATRRIVEAGCPIIRTISGTGLLEGGSFMWIDTKTAVISTGLCANRAGVEQMREALAYCGVELLTLQTPGFSQHLDGFMAMVDVDKALINPTMLPYDFIAVLRARGIEMIHICPEDPPFAINALPLSPGRVIASEMSERTLETLDRKGIEVTSIPYEPCWRSGGGIHCNTAPLARDTL
jgi:N-dimethylarginine dimethylaminohydrolase